MRELSLNILDITQNSITADSTTVMISIGVTGNLMTIAITDNGKGMDEEMVKRVTDPFTTSRTTRKVGMGLPLFKMASENSGGTLSVTSTVGVGTKVTATFEVNNIDRPPLGDVASVYTGLIYASPNIRFIFKFSYNGENFSVDTEEIKANIGSIPINEYEVLKFVEEMINENMNCICKGVRL